MALPQQLSRLFSSASVGAQTGQRGWLWVRHIPLALFLLVLAGAGSAALIANHEVNKWQAQQQAQAQSASQAVAASVTRLKEVLSLLGALGPSLQIDPSLAQILLQNMRDIDEIVLLDSKRQVLASTAKAQALLADSLPIAASEWLSAVRFGQLHWELLPGSGTAPAALVLATQLENGSLVAAQIQDELFQHALSTQSESATGSTYLVDEQGRLLAYIGPPLATQTVDLLSRPEIRAMRAAAGQGWRGRYQSFTGVDVIGAGAIVPGSDWLVVAEIPRQTIFAPSRPLLQISVGSLTLLGLLALVLGAIRYQRPSGRPLASLRGRSDRTPVGDLPAHEIVGAGRETLVYSETLLADGIGQPNGSLGATLDIVQQHQAQTALRTLEARYRLLIEQLPAITYTAALGERVQLLYVSPQIERLGFAAVDWISDAERFLRQIHEEDRPRVQARLQTLQTGAAPNEIDYRIYDSSGRITWVHDHASVIYDDSGAPLCIQGSMFDITRHKETEAAVQDGAQRIRLIADNLPALIAYVDEHQIYQFANRQFEEWYSTSTIVGQHLCTVAGEQNYAAIRDYVETALAGTPVTFDYSRVYPDGRRRFVELAYIPHIQADGKVLGFFTLVQDLTERKQAEEQIKASLDEKVILLKEIHHRVKNNLQVITSLLYLQAEQIEDAALRAILQDSQNRVRSMALIHEKLYQARDLVRVDIGEYVQNLTSYLFRSYATQADGVTLQVQTDNIHLAIDTAMPCGLIINELLSNALKHGFPDGRHGQVSVGLQRDSDQQITLCVSDTGVGFPLGTSIAESSSLGLQLVTTLVNQLDGSLAMQRDNGTKFLIRFREAH